MAIGGILKGHDLFRSLTPADVDRISSFAALRKCVAGDVLYRQGDVSTHVFLLVEGRVYLRLSSVRAVNVALTEIGRGELFGLSPILGARHYPVAAQCATDSQILTIEAKPLQEIFEANPATGLHVMRWVANAYFDRYVEVTKRLQAIVDQIPMIP